MNVLDARAKRASGAGESRSFRQSINGHVFAEDDLLKMVAKIAIVHFALETLIMLLLTGWDLHAAVIYEDLLDATLLTIGSTPLIFFWVARPFVRAAQDARSVLGHELVLRSQQAVQLAETLERFKSLLEQNELLRLNLEKVNQDVGNANERVLQRVGAELHDGPAQILTYCHLILDKLEKTVSRAGSERDRKTFLDVRDGLSKALREVRSISSGVSLPELETCSFEEAVTLVVRQHEERTNTYVQTSVREPPLDVTYALKVCVYRVIQEALRNAYRHAGGHGQRLAVEGGSKLRVAVSDSGSGIEPTSATNGGLGLLGMRARVQALGGEFKITRNTPNGTRIEATFCLNNSSGEGR